jgi:IclR family transcriptional regulator, pca regulon regulatory protein
MHKDEKGAGNPASDRRGDPARKARAGGSGEGVESGRGQGSSDRRSGGVGGRRARVDAAARRPRIRSVPDPRLSRSLEYGVAMLESFSRERPALGIAEMAEIVGTSRSTAHRYAMTLVALGYLEQDSKRKYRLARRAGDTGAAAIGAIRRQVPARAVLEELRDQTGHTVSMGALEGGRVVFVHRLLGHRSGQYAVDRDLAVGANVPAHCTAIGKVLLASLSDADRRELLAGLRLERCGPRSITDRAKLIRELERIGSRAPLVSDEEHARGVRSIAVLIPRPRSERPLAIEVTVPASTYTVEQLLKGVGPRLKRAARLISS